jgi:hypothetical protein
MLRPVGGPLNGDLEERIHEAEHRDGTGNAGLLRGLRTGDWLDAQDFPPLEYAIPGVIPEGFSMLAGAPKIGKSWIALDWALAVASGGRALGHIDVGPPRPVFGLWLEDSDRRLQDRARRLLQGAPIPPMFHYLTRVEPGAVLTTLRALFGMYPEELPPFGILDTLGKCMPPAMAGETTYGRDYRIGSAIKAIADDHPGSALLVLHHDRKADSSDFVDAISGTNGLAGSADTLAVLSRNRHETEGTIALTSRDVGEAEYALELKEGVAWCLVGADLKDAASKAATVRASAGLGDRSIDVLVYVQKHPHGVSPKQVVDALEITDARKYLERLAKAGRICNPKRALYTPVTTVPLSQTNGSMGHRDGSDTPHEHLDFMETER